MGRVCLLWLSALGSVGLLACSDKRLYVGSDTGGHPVGSGGTTTPTGSGGSGGASGQAGDLGRGGSAGAGTAGVPGTGGSAGMTGAGGTAGSFMGAAGSIGSAGAGGASATSPALSLLAGALGGPGNLDGTGAAARFSYPAGIASDGAGNLFVTDWDSHTVRKIVIATGAVTTFAGAPGQHDAVDGIGADARFSDPYGIASDKAGNLFVADANNGSIRKVVIATRAVTTLARGLADPYGIVSDGSGNLFVADSNNDTIRKVVIATGAVTTLAGAATLIGGTDGNGAAARFDHPAGITSDRTGNLFVADAGNKAIRKIVIATGAVTTLVIAPAAPFGIASDGMGTLYFSDTGSIQKLVLATGAVTTLAGAASDSGSVDGTGTAARFWAPAEILADGTGNLFVADHNNHTIRKVVIATGVVTTLAGTAGGRTGSADETGAAARFKGPTGVATDGAGNLYIADTGNSVIRKIVIATGAVTTLAGAAGQAGNADGTGTAARFKGPADIASDGAGNLYIADRDNNNIRKLVIATGAVTTLAGLAGAPGSADGTGTTARFGGLYGIGPSGLAYDGAGNLFVTDSYSNAIRKVVIATGAVTTPAGLAGQIGSADGTGAAARFNFPQGIASDGAGNLYIADGSNNAIRKLVVATGAVTTLAGVAGPSGSTDGRGATARFNYPQGIAIDGAGNLYVAERNNTIRKVVIATGAVSTAVGSPGRIGVSTGALPASLSDPRGVAVLPTGDLAIVDYGENAVLIGHL